MFSFSRDLKVFASALALTALTPEVGAFARGTAALYSFEGGDDAAYSHAGLFRDSKGNLYGTTQGGGINGGGTVFKVTAKGSESVLYSFSYGNDGGQPIGGVIADKSGNLYGTTVGGGAYGEGVLFEVTQGGSESVLYTFCSLSSCTDGAGPRAGLIMDSSGNLYGTTFVGGASDAGAVFELTPDGTETVLYSFCSLQNCTDGGFPYSGLIEDKTGNLFGTTLAGGTDNYGTVFELAPDGTETVLYAFAGGSDGWYPHATPVLDSSGNVYGPTEYGGGSGCDGYGCGTVYKVTPSGSETVLHAFSGGSDGMVPLGSLYLDKTGNVYGTTLLGGGSGCDGYGCGTVFKIAPSGSKTLVHAFDGTDGANAESSNVADSKGYLYGTTKDGGAYGFGTVFKVKE